MKLQLIESKPTVAFIADMHEVALLHHMFSFLSGESWRAQYSHDYPAREIDDLVATIRSSTRTLLDAVQESETALRSKLR